MPRTAVGKNCCIVNCFCTSSKCRGLSFHYLPKAGVTEEQDQWRDRMIHAIGRIDSFNPDKVTICSRHFSEDCLKHGSLPTLWMQPKSIETPKPTPRKEPTDREPPPEPEVVSYFDFEDIRKDLHSVQLPWCITDNSAITVKLAVVLDSVVKLQVTLQSDANMMAFVHVFGIPAPHLSISLECMKLSKFLRELQDMSMCEGITAANLQNSSWLPGDSASKQHFRLILNQTVNGVFSHTSSIRSRTCELLLSSREANSGSVCKHCLCVEKTLLDQQQRQEARIRQLKPHDPLHRLSVQQMKEAFKTARHDKKNAEKELNIFREKMERESVQLTKEMHDNLKAVSVSSVEDPLLKLFWEEQTKAFTAGDHGMRWHPMMIRLAILLHSKGQGAYETLRKTGVLKLPGASTLREYIHAVQPGEGFQVHVQEELQKVADKLKPHQRYVALLHDEMSVKSDLVFDKRSGELVGFVNKDTWNFKGTGEKLATQALVFYVVGINSDLKMSLGFFGTKSATADQLFPLFWQAVGFVEETGLKVMTSTSDKAPQNQRLYQMHSQGEDVCYKTVNVFSPDRNIYFISDPPHLVKTVRNNLSSSGSGKNTKLLWNNGHHILWKHIADLYRRDSESVLRRTKLTSDHIHLTPHSVMNVRLAAQVLSHQVGSVMQQYGPLDSQETAKFVLLMDRFFDCLNSRSLAEAGRKRKLDLMPYTREDDQRFQFLAEDFLQYLENWKTSTHDRPGHFTGGERQKMFLTHQTYRGLVMTVRAFVEVAKFLLANGVDFVLSNKFCQDPIEEHFGRHRGIGRTADNPNLFQFGYQENRLRLQRQLALKITPKGNVRGAKKEETVCTISTSPLKKKART